MPIKILAVDDEEDNLRLYRALIRNYLPDAEVQTAQGGEAGLAAIAADPPDLVLLDARMPGMNGFEVCRRIKTTPATTHIPVLMVSGAYVESRHRVSGFEGGADAYMCKPFQAQELVAQLKALLLEVRKKAPSFRVMVVDDSRTSRQIVTAELKRNPYVEIAAFENVPAALAALDAVKPDLVVSDEVLPDMDGFRFCETLRSHPDYRHVPFVLLSENATSAALERAQKAGVTDVFPKPFKSTELADYVGRHVNLRRDWFDHDVLVVDATSVIRKILKQYLGGMRLKVHEADNVEQAQDILRNHPIDLIIVDHDLPGKTGLQWCEELRATPEYRWVPILGLSADSELALSFIKAGADDYLSRELVKEEIVIRARNLLRRVTLTKELNAAIGRERALNEHKNRVLGVAAHDIRAPIAGVAHYAEVLLSGRMEDREFLQKSLQTIHDVARHALDLLNKILDVSSIQSGVVEMERGAVRLDELLAERLEFMNQIGSRKGIVGELVNRVPAGEAVQIEGDRRRLSQVIDNLLGNVIKYSGRDRPYTVSVDKEVEGWLVRVADHGPGIPSDELFSVFDEFGRTSVQASGGEKSTGLGLAIAKRLIEAHGGTIWIDSEVGKGTTVSFVLPRYKAEAA
ncbi:MAG: response regulator [Kiritimatiellae bacterium]|nr:response regulator [Kiritimatiellia bacterium]